MKYAVVVCPACREPWAVETRSERVRCPRCGSQTELAQRRRLWEGDDSSQAQLEAGRQRAVIAGGHDLMGPAPQARHDSPADAAAAKASAFAGKSQRAEAVALWLTRLNGPTPHLEFMQALEKAGLDAARAEAEVVRMLACDILFEPQAGRYALVESAT